MRALEAARGLAAWYEVTSLSTYAPRTEETHIVTLSLNAMPPGGRAVRQRLRCTMIVVGEDDEVGK